MAADDKSSSSSSTEWSVEPPVLSPASPSHLTHFKPLTPEQDEPPLRSAYSSFVNLFRFNNKDEGRPPSAAADKPDVPSPSPQSDRRSWSTSPSHSLYGSGSHRKQHGDHVRRTSTASVDWPDGSRKADAPLSNHDPRTAVQLRTALKRLKEIMEGKSQVPNSLSFYNSDLFTDGPSSLHVNQSLPLLFTIVVCVSVSVVYKEVDSWCLELEG